MTPSVARHPQRRSRLIVGVVALTVTLAALPATTAGAADPTMPGEPTDASVVSEIGAVFIWWHAPTDDGGSPVTAYDVRIGDEAIRFDEDELLALQRPDHDPSSWQVAVPGGPPGGVAVRAVNAIGPGPWHDLGPQSGAIPAGYFVDVPLTHPFWTEIATAQMNALVVGYQVDEQAWFRPGAAVSRQAAVTFLWRLADEPAGPFPDPVFSDVGPDHPYRVAIAWAASEGIVEGYDDGTFRGGAPVSRQVLVVLQWRRAGSPTPSCLPPGYPDVVPGSPFSDAIAWATCEGIAHGYDDGTFRPGAVLSRQAAVAFLVRPIWFEWEPFAP